VFAIGAPNGPAGAPGAIGGVAPNPLAPGNAEVTWLNAGAAEVQPWGTDNAPSVAALPTPAETAVSPIAGEPKAPAPEPSPGVSADPKIWNPLPTALVVDPSEFMAEPAEPSIDADEAIPDTRLVPDVTAVDDELTVVRDDSGDVDVVVDAAVDASPSSALGIAADVSGVDNTVPSGVDTAEVSGVTVRTPVPAEVPAAWVTAAAKPAGSVVWAGVVNDVNVDAADDAPA
jgi:hypothetical protein